MRLAFSPAIDANQDGAPTGLENESHSTIITRTWSAD